MQQNYLQKNILGVLSTSDPTVCYDLDIKTLNRYGAAYAKNIEKAVT